SAVRITHVPTGIVVTCQDEKSQLKNKLKALGVLRSRLLAAELERRSAEESAKRKSQIGTGDRSEKIRTYTFPQDRITDHRIGLTVHGVARVLSGDLEKIIEALAQADAAAKMEE
ncbi:MAG: peptide chain release factor-like protein, partial [bacterium]